MRRAFGILLVTTACGALGGGGSATTTAHQTQSLAFRGDECRTVWHRMKDASGTDLEWTASDASGNSAWTRGEGIDGDKREKRALQAMCFDALGKEAVVQRYLRTDDRRFDDVDAAILVDECVESGKCDADPMVAGLVAWYARKLELTKLSAAGQKLDMSQEARDAFVDRSLGNVKRLEAAIARLSAGERQYAVDLPKQVHDARDAYYTADADEYTTLDRTLERIESSSASLLTIRSDAAARCGDAKKCEYDPLYRETSRWLAKAYELSKMPLEARAVTLTLGREHARRGTTPAQVWAAQMAFRKIHPEVKPPVAVTEEDAPVPETTDVVVVRGELAPLSPPAHGTAKLAFKDPAPYKDCTDGDIEGFEGPLEETHVLYKQTCTDHPAGAKIEPFVVAASDVATLKPGAIVIAAVSGTGAARRGVVARVMAGDKIVQLGPDKFVSVTGDPLSGKP
jgi:hypothetical protein